MAEELIINVGIGGDSVPKLTSDVDKLGTEIDGTAKSFDNLNKSQKETETKSTSLRQQIRIGREELANMTKGTQEYADKLKTVAGLQAKFTAVNRELKASQATLGQTLTNVNNVVGGLAGGFSVATGVMNLFGIESDSSMKALIKMQSLMSITSGLASMNKAFRSFDGLSAVFGDLFKSSTMVNSAINDNVVSSNNLITTTNVTTASVVGETSAINNETIAMNTSSVAKDTNAVSNIALSSSTEVSTISNELNTKSKQKGALSSFISATWNTILGRSVDKLTVSELTASDAFELETLSTETNTISKVKNTSSTDTNTTSTNTNTESQINNGNATESAGLKIIKQIGKLSLWAIGLFAVIWAIQSLIEWMNKIPKDLEIKIKLNEDAEKNTSKLRELIMNIQHDLALINVKQDENANKQLSSIKQVMIANGIATKSQIGDLNAKSLADSKYFKDYLKKVENNAYDEALIKKKVAAKIESDTQFATAAMLRKELDKNYKPTDSGLSPSKTIEQGGLLSGAEYGIGKKYAAALDALEISNKEIKLLNTLKIKGDYIVKPEKTGDTGGSSSLTQTSLVNKSFFKADIKKVEKYDKEYIDYVAKYTEKYKGMTQEQIQIDKNQIEESKKYQSQMVLGYDLNGSIRIGKIRKLTNEIKVEEAKQLDLKGEQTFLINKIRIDTEKNVELERTSKERLKINKEEYDSAVINDNKLVDQMNNTNSKINKLEKEKTDFVEETEKHILVLKKKINDNSTKEDKENNQKQIDNYITGRNKILVVNNKKIDDLKTQSENEQKLLTESRKKLEKLQEDRTKAEEKLRESEKTGIDIEKNKSELDKINSDIIDSQASTAELVRQIWEEKLDNVRNKFSSVGEGFSKASKFTQDLMTINDNVAQQKKNQLDQDIANGKVSVDNKEEELYKIEKAQYDSNVKIFEWKKGMDIGKAAIDGISAELTAIRNFSANGGFMNPFAIAGLVAETVLIGASTMATISEISSRKLEAPTPPSSKSAPSASGGGGGMNGQALNPNKSALTSSQENLNMMNNSSKSNQPTTVVKVSDINSVQNTVKVRENNSSY